MAVDTETINIDTIEKDLWDKIVAAGNSAQLPKVTSTDNGDLLGVSSGKWAKVDAPTNIYTVNATLSTGEGGKAVFTTDKTAAEGYAAISAGKIINCHATGTSLDVELIVQCVCQKMDIDGTVTYGFRFIDDEGAAFSAADLAGTDTIVFTEE